MLNESWRRAGTVLAWITAVSLLGAAVLFAYQAFVPLDFGEEPEDFVEFLLHVWEVQRTRWPLEMLSSLLFTLGLLGLGALGLVLRRLLGPDDARSVIAGASLLGAGVIGAVSQLIVLGARQLALDPGYCDCNYLAEEVIGRSQALDMISFAGSWLVYALLFLAGVGLVLIAKITLDRGPLDRRWAWLSLTLAAVNAITIVAGETGPFELWALLITLAAGLLTPAWAAWLAFQLSDLDVERPAVVL